MTILMIETLDQTAMETLGRQHELVMSPSPRALDHDLPFSDIDAIITRGLGQIDAPLMAACPRLKVIARAGAGLNNIDLDTAKEKEIKVVFAPGLNAAAVAEHTLMLMLNCLRQGPRASCAVKQGNWNCRDTYDGDDLRGKLVAVVGAGNIGRRVANLCAAFGMDVLLISRQGNGHKELMAQLRDAAATADLISLHVPLTDDTRQMIDVNLLQQCKPGVVFINTSRGALIDEAAVLHGLQSGQLGFYAADVMTEQPPAADHPMIAHDKCSITPHMASLTKSTWAETSNFIAANVLTILNQKSPEPMSIYSGGA